MQKVQFCQYTFLTLARQYTASNNSAQAQYTETIFPQNSIHRDTIHRNNSSLKTKFSLTQFFENLDNADR